MSKRQMLMLADVQSVENTCKTDPACPFVAFEQSKNTFGFTLAANGEVVIYTFSMGDDYPDNTVLTYSHCPDQPLLIHERIPTFFNRISPKYWKNSKFVNPLPSVGLKESEETTDFWLNEDSPSSDMDVNIPAIEDGDDTNDSDYDDDDEDDNNVDEDYYNTDGEDVSELYSDEDEQAKMHPLLAHDIDQVKQLGGNQALSYRMFDALGDVDIDLQLDVSFLQDEIAKAWCLNREQPLVVRLHCSLNKYLDENSPQVSVFQSSKSNQPGVCSQMKKITQSFLLAHWKSLSNKAVLAHLKSREKSPSKTCQRDGHRNHSNTSRGRTLTIPISFSRSSSSMSQSPSSESPSPVSPDSSSKKFGKKIFPWQPFQRSTSTGHSPPSPGKEELHLIPAATEDQKQAKQIPSLENGFLWQMYGYLKNRIPTLSEFCVVCDEPHIFQNGAMLKPAVCERELCVFSFQMLGVMQDAAENIATGAEVVDLLVSMVLAAVKSRRRQLILDPFPSVVDPKNSKELAFSPKKKNFDRLESTLDKFSSMTDMLAAGSVTDMKKQMDKMDVLAYPLLQWIISSNRSHIVKLPTNKQIRFMHTPHQFLLLSSTPSKETAFRKAKQEHGSIFAFHGSNIENWHSILRHGLINASGTKHQMHGAAYGKGIYLSPHSSVSFGYSGMGHGIHQPVKKLPPVEPKKSACRFLQSKNLRCIALCEVISSKELNRHGHVWVCCNPDHVCTRFFFVYEDGKVGDQGVDTTQDKYTKDILSAMADWRTL
ncbi:protein mono-ADP-ribosyltransferase PARP6-like [Lytechinus variegatus]|uniref:protein mono-ADP-ribosyltransferase PARP6-like n=1 Tax=Lytechinus variegatus TaxID=7654 RepID=UPI001BB2BBD1|nr:protein mono-ADP-ribosyltransferase PARP6-like [Lytechinus variegatus]